MAAYREHGDIHLAESRDAAMVEIVRDYVADNAERPDGSRVAMAHRRADVRALNTAIRSELQNRQRLERGHGQNAGADRGDRGDVEDRGNSENVRELTFQTRNGKRAFAAGDRIIFLENNRDLGVKNGMLGTVEHVEPNKIIARLDRRSGDSVSILTDSYQAIDHGYATTIHKNQGATVDRAFVLASSTMDRHLAYVAMTRHRDSVQLYAGIEEFTSADRLVDHGVAPYEHNPQSRASYFVTLENDKGDQRTVWGVDLRRAMREASPQIGDRIALQHEGATPVTLPDGTKAERNAWRVVKGDELAYQKLATRLSRSDPKETTLDYISDFAERRGIAEQLGLKARLNLLPLEIGVSRFCPARPIQCGNNRAGHQSVSRLTRNVPAIWPVLLTAKILAIRSPEISMTDGKTTGQRIIKVIAASGGPTSCHKVAPSLPPQKLSASDGLWRLASSLRLCRRLPDTNAASNRWRNKGRCRLSIKNSIQSNLWCGTCSVIRPRSPQDCAPR